MPRARIILSRDPAATFTPYDRFRHYARNRGRSLASLLDEFGRLRAANLEGLIAWNLGDAELDLPGRAPEPWPGHAATAARHLGGARPRPRRPGRPGHGQAVPGPGRALGGVPAGAHRPRVPSVLA